MNARVFTGLAAALLLSSSAVHAQVPPSHPHSYAMPQYYHNNVYNYGRYGSPNNFQQTNPYSPGYQYYQTPLISNPPRGYVPIVPDVQRNSFYPTRSQFLYGLTDPGPTPMRVPVNIPEVQPARLPDAPASFRVSLPVEDAKLWVDGQLTKQSGTVRLFETPDLTSGKTYTYTLKATWKEGDREFSVEKTIDVQPRKESSVTLSKPEK